MARTPLIFSQADSVTLTGATYTVPAGKYAIADVNLSGSSSGGARCEINGKNAFQFSNSGIVSGSAVLPAGTTIQCIASNAVQCCAIASGFLYDL